MALNQGEEGACRFVFITDLNDTLFGQELYFEGGFCLSARVTKDTIINTFH